MRVIVTMVTTALSLTATPVMAAEFRDPSLAQRFMIEKRNTLTEASNSDFEKLRTARYGLNDLDEDDYQPVSEETRVRWKLNRIKMRMPFDTSRFQ